MYLVTLYVMHKQHSLSPPLSPSVHVKGLGSGIRDRCKPEVEIQSNSAAITAEEMSRLGSRLILPRLLLHPGLIPIGPLLERRRHRPIGTENGDLRGNRCADVCTEDSAGFAESRNKRLRGSHEPLRH